MYLVSRNQLVRWAQVFMCQLYKTNPFFCAFRTQNEQLIVVVQITSYEPHGRDGTVVMGHVDVVRIGGKYKFRQFISPTECCYAAMAMTAKCGPSGRIRETLTAGHHFLRIQTTHRLFRSK